MICRYYSIRHLYPACARAHVNRISTVKTSGYDSAGDAGAFRNITADTEPNYDNWGPDEYWKCADWITWHKKLKEVYGGDEANTRFIIAFQKAGFGAASYDCRSFNSSFRAYAKKQGFFNGLYDGIGGLLARPVGLLNDANTFVTNIVSNTFDAGSQASKALKIIVPVLVFGGTFALIYYGYKKVKAA